MFVVTVPQSLKKRMEMDCRIKAITFHKGTCLAGQYSTTIDALPIECLLHIFSFLPLVDRIHLESVCSRWKDVCELTWRTFKRLDTLKSMWGTCHVSKSHNTLRMALLKQVLSYTGQYLTVIDLWHNCAKESSYQIDPIYTPRLCNHPSVHTRSSPCKGLLALAQHCHSIRELNVCSCIVSCSEDALKHLFIENRTIRILNLRGMTLSGKCLKYLSKHLESLRLDRSDMECKKLCKHLPRFCSLHTFSINEPWIEDLVKHGDKLLAIVGSWAPTLRCLDLGGFGSPDLPIKSFKHLWKLKNLKDLALCFTSIDNQDMYQIATYLQHLTRLSIAECYRVTDEGISYLLCMSKLEYLNIAMLRKLTNRALVQLPKSLRILDAARTKFSVVAILKMLERLENMEMLNLFRNYKIRNDFVNQVVDMKRLQQNKKMLTLKVEPPQVIKNDRLKMSPYLKLIGAVTVSEMKYRKKVMASGNSSKAYKQYFELGDFKPFYVIDCHEASCLDVSRDLPTDYRTTTLYDDNSNEE